MTCRVFAETTHVVAGHVDLHVWSYPRRSHTFSVSSKSVQGFWSHGRSKFAVFHCSRYWLLQQHVLPFERRDTHYTVLPDDANFFLFEFLFISKLLRGHHETQSLGWYSVGGVPIINTRRDRHAPDSCCIHGVTVKWFRSISMPVDFCRHLVGKSSEKWLSLSQPLNTLCW